MKTRLLFAVFLLYIGIANAVILRCYECSSRSSWDDCNGSQDVKDCLWNEEQCPRFLAQVFNPISGSSKASYSKVGRQRENAKQLKLPECARILGVKTSGARISCFVFCSSGSRSNGGKLPDLCKPGYHCPNGSTELSWAILCRYGTYQTFDSQPLSSSCIQCPNATMSHAEPLTSCSTDRPFASSSPTESAGEIAGGIVGSIILLVVAYVVVKKRRRRGNTNVYTGMLHLAYNLDKGEKELEEQEQEEGFTAKQLRFSI